jgi:hypothetical protein
MASFADIITNIIFVFKIVQKFLSKRFKICRSIPLINVLILLTTIVFIYQSILLSIDYLNYETVIDLKLKDGSISYSPAISLCLRSKLLRSDFGNSTISDYIGNVSCHISIKGEGMIQSL